MRRKQTQFQASKKYIFVYLIVSLYFITTTASKEVVRKAIQLVITDESFNLPSESSKYVRKSAERLLEWSSDPESSCLFGSFASELVMQLETCFGSHQSLQRRWEKMWEKLFKLHSSPSFKSKWSSFFVEASAHLLAQYFINMLSTASLMVLLSNTTN